MADHVNLSMLAHFAFASQFSLGIIFLLSAAPKLSQPLTFARSVVTYDVLPSSVAYSFGLVLVPLEAFLAISFLSGYWTSLALPLALVLLLAFLGAVGINLRRERRIECGCFGHAREPISGRVVARLLLLLAVVLLLMTFRGLGGASLPDLGSLLVHGLSLKSLASTFFLGVSLLLLGAWILNVPELVSLIRYSR